MAKFLITAIHVNLCCLIPASLGIAQISSELLELFAINLQYTITYFLAVTFDFTTFFTLAMLTELHLFFNNGQTVVQ